MKLVSLILFKASKLKTFAYKDCVSKNMIKYVDQGQLMVTGSSNRMLPGF